MDGFANCRAETRLNRFMVPGGIENDRHGQVRDMLTRSFMTRVGFPGDRKAGRNCSRIIPLLSIRRLFDQMERNESRERLWL